MQLPKEEIPGSVNIRISSVGSNNANFPIALPLTTAHLIPSLCHLNSLAFTEKGTTLTCYFMTHQPLASPQIFSHLFLLMPTALDSFTSAVSMKCVYQKCNFLDPVYQDLLSHQYQRQHLFPVNLPSTTHLDFHTSAI